MGEKLLRNIFIFGTLVFLTALAVMTVDSLQQVASIRTPQLTDAVVAGKMTWQEKNCNDCHTILGIGGYFAPELTKVVTRRDPVWLNNYLMDPQVAKPGTTMPNQRLSATQASALVSLFQWVNLVDTNDWPPKPMANLGGAAASPAAQGALLFEQKGCSACHMIAGQGSPGPGPDLTRIGGIPYNNMPNDKESLEKWLENPQQVKPGTTMPLMPLTGDERDAVVDYLVTLK